MIHLTGIFEQSRNRVGIGLSHRPARQQRLAESIPGFLKSLKIPPMNEFYSAEHEEKFDESCPNWENLRNISWYLKGQ
jgi:hypothetical protein